ncbi:MAG: bifunctional phosphopantothenoylcysteine decarboxylase/phosphopantothenate--cysteine ligase CoaBC [Elusimicrobiota bacterium]
MIKSVKGKTVVLGITGSIAAYKAAELARRLMKLGLKIRCVLTPSAGKFVTPLMFQSLTGEKAFLEMFDADNWEAGHVALAKSADVVVIAPCTANTINKLAVGVSDNLLTCTVLAAKVPVIIAPAMNDGMYNNIITQRNITELKSRNVIFVNPVKGMLASGYTGIGHLAEIDNIVSAVVDTLTREYDNKILYGKTVLITAGATREYIDPVRYITNASTGKMGTALAVAMKYAGANVVFVKGATVESTPPVDKVVTVDSAEQMYDACNKYFTEADVFISVAAVSDYRADKVVRSKIKSGKDGLQLMLVPNRDILFELAANKADKVVVGFSLETEDLVNNSVQKLKKKNLDLIVANTAEVIGSNDTSVVIITSTGKKERVVNIDKYALAQKIVSYVAGVLEQKSK